MTLKRSLPTTIVEHCRQLRHDATPPEERLWFFLRNRRFGGFKFRRQHPVAGYILDFYCHEAHLAIEVDGSSHNAPDQVDYDSQRTASLNDTGIIVLRFWNNEVSNQMYEVLRAIWDALPEQQ